MLTAGVAVRTPNEPDGLPCDASNDVCDTINAGVGTCLPPLTGSAGQVWKAASGWTGTVPCVDGIRFNVDGSFVWGCSTTAGFFFAANGPAGETFAASNSGIDNLAGLSVGVHSAMAGVVLMSATPVAGKRQLVHVARLRWDVVVGAVSILDSAGALESIASSRVQQGVGGLWPTFDAVSGDAVVLTGSGGGPSASNPVTVTSANPMSAVATGTARAIVPGKTGGGSDLLLAVFGQRPDGTSGTGGVFRGATKGTVWNEIDTGIAAADKNLVFSVIAATDVSQDVRAWRTSSIQARRPGLQDVERRRGRGRSRPPGCPQGRATTRTPTLRRTPRC